MGSDASYMYDISYVVTTFNITNHFTVHQLNMNVYLKMHKLVQWTPAIPGL